MVLERNLIATDVPAASWREAAHLAGQLLVDAGKVSPAFPNDLIETVERFGPYMIIVPEVAFFHAPPSKDIYEACISFVTLERTVRFEEFNNQPISCAFAFGAVDNDSHLAMLQDVARLLRDGSFVKLALSHASADELVDCAKRLTDGEDAVQDSDCSKNE